MKLLNSETFNPNDFIADYTLLVWYSDINNVSREIKRYESIPNLEIYGIDINNEDNACLVDYYGLDVSNGVCYTIFNDEHKMIQSVIDINMLEPKFLAQ